MSCATTGDPIRPSAEALAQLMLQSAREDTSLTRRLHAPGLLQSGTGALTTRQEPRLAIASLADYGVATEQHLEDLVTIAVSSARQADVALEQALQANRNARRWSVAGVIAAAVLMGFYGISEGQLKTKVDQGLSNMTREVSTLGDNLRQTSEKLAGLYCGSAETQVAAAAEPPPAPDASKRMVHASANEPISRPNFAPPVNSLQSAVYSPVWPTQPALRR